MPETQAGLRLETDGVRLFLEDYRKPLLILHAVTAFALGGSCIHHLTVSANYLRGRFGRIWLEKLHTRVIFGCYLGLFTLGLLMYPTYRYRVRAGYFDRELPAISNLFDLKEVWAGVGLPLAISLFALGFVVDPKRDRHVLPFYVFLSATLTLIAWFNIVSGLIAVSYRSV